MVKFFRETPGLVERTTTKIIIPEVRETLIFEAPRCDKSPCCTRLSLHITVYSKSFASGIVNLVETTAGGPTPKMIDARPWFGFCSFSWAEVSLQKESMRVALKCLTFRLEELCHRF